jgi:hypothetical protein
MIRHPLSLALCVLMVGVMSLISAPRASGRQASRPAKPRVVATVTAMAPRGMATIQTVDGALYEVVKGTTWRVGDTVECEQNERTRVPWEALDCRKVS